MNKNTGNRIALLISLIVILCILREPYVVQAEESRLPSGITTTEFEKELDQFVDENQAHTAALAVAVVSQDKKVLEKTYGYADIENQIVADSNTVFEWGSVTKVLTWISVMQLVEQGKLDLKEDIRKYLPDNYLKKISYHTPVTMLDLMNHTGGWQDCITDTLTDRVENLQPLDAQLAKHELRQLYEPGTTVAYSNWGAALAGLIVEKVSGEDYCDYVNKHIFTPLGMKHTSIHPSRSDNAFVKEQLPKTKGYTGELKLIPGRFYSRVYPADGAAGTLGDARLLLEALLGEEATPLFKDNKTLELMLSPTHYYLDGEYPENAHGLWYDSYQTESLGHCGNSNQFSMHLSFNPRLKTGMVVMTNQAQETIYNTGVGNLVFGKCDEENRNSEAWSEHHFQKYYLGARTIKKGYCSVYNYFQVFRVKVTGENKILISSPFIQLPCIRIDDTVYLVNEGVLKGYKIHVATAANGEVKKMATYTFDIVEWKDAKVILDNISFLLVAIALLMTLFAFGYHIRTCFRKREADTFYKMGMNFISILFYVFYTLEIVKLFSSTATTGAMLPFVLFDILFAVLSVIYAVYFIRTKNKKMGSILTLSSMMIITGFILYWQMYYIS